MICMFLPVINCQLLPLIVILSVWLSQAFHCRLAFSSGSFVLYVSSISFLNSAVLSFLYAGPHLKSSPYHYSPLSLPINHWVHPPFVSLPILSFHFSTSSFPLSFVVSYLHLLAHFSCSVHSPPNPFSLFLTAKR